MEKVKGKMKKIMTAIFLTLTSGLILTSCKKDCQPSTMDCSTIYYQCQPGEEVCGCDGVTYNCSFAAECEGRISEYTKGKCK